MLTTVLKMPPSVPAASSTSTSETFIRSQDRAVTGALHPARPASGCDPYRIRPTESEFPAISRANLFPLNLAGILLLHVLLVTVRPSLANDRSRASAG